MAIDCSFSETSAVIANKICVSGGTTATPTNNTETNSTQTPERYSDITRSSCEQLLVFKCTGKGSNITPVSSEQTPIKEVGDYNQAKQDENIKYFEKLYKQEQIEWMQTGWNNPKSIGKPIQRKEKPKIIIRNRLK